MSFKSIVNKTKVMSKAKELKGSGKPKRKKIALEPRKMRKYQ